MSNWTEIGIGTTGTAVHIDGAHDTRVINQLVNGRKLLTYSEYLRLTDLLGSQIPATTVPDERAFIITHQAIELAFRLCLFDLYVIGRTLDQLLETDAATHRHLSLFSDSLDGEGWEATFWRPARTAAARVRFSAEAVLPNLLSLIGREGSATFSTREFAIFRSALEPASGFQSVQFRLLERAFGKAGLLALPVFPVDVYARNYESARPMSTLEPVESSVFFGSEGTGGSADEAELVRYASSVSDLIDNVLARLAPPGTMDLEPPSCALITASQLAAAVEGLVRIFARHANQVPGELQDEVRERQQREIQLFRAALIQVTEKENERRERLSETRRGAYALRLSAPTSALIEILDALVAADDSLFGSKETSFLTEHQLIAMTRIKRLRVMAEERAESIPPEGTGGGGPPYLAWRRSYLVPLFPMLPAYRGLEDTEVLSWIE
jgi:tryptophan 2,3-dioxygenase